MIAVTIVATVLVMQEDFETSGIGNEAVGIPSHSNACTVDLFDIHKLWHLDSYDIVITVCDIVAGLFVE